MKTDRAFCQPSIGDTVAWFSPYTEEEVPMNFRGYNGDDAILFNPKSGMQLSVPKDQIKRVIAHETY